MLGITCCKGCTDRVVGCHATCTRYLNDRERHLEDKKKYSDFKRKESMVTDVAIRGVTQTKKSSSSNHLKEFSRGNRSSSWKPVSNK